MLIISVGRIVSRHGGWQAIWGLEGVNPGTISHIVDWLTADYLAGAAWIDRVDEKGRPLKLMKCGSIERLLYEADKAMRKRLQSAVAALSEGDEITVATLRDGYTVVRLMTPLALDVESRRMRHCVGHDYEVEGDDDQDLAMATALTQLNDHRLIMRRALPEREPWLPAHALQEHKRSREWLKAELAKPFDGPTVVVTHHAPHPLSIHHRFRGSMLNGAFVSDLSEVMESFGPELWIHGHVHDSHDYRVGKTRVACNPKGYGSENPAFDPSLIVEV